MAEYLGTVAQGGDTASQLAAAGFESLSLGVPLGGSSGYLIGLTQINPGASNVTISGFSIYLEPYAGIGGWPANTKIVLALYSDNGGYPGTLVAQAAEITLPQGTMSGAWYTANISGNFTLQGGTTPTKYWIVLVGNGIPATPTAVMYVAASGSYPIVYTQNTAGNGDTPPATWPASGETAWGSYSSAVVYAVQVTASATAALTGGTVPAGAVLQRTAKTGGAHGLGYRAINITGSYANGTPTSATTASWGGTAVPVTNFAASGGVWSCTITLPAIASSAGAAPATLTVTPDSTLTALIVGNDIQVGDVLVAIGDSLVVGKVQFQASGATPGSFTYSGSHHPQMFAATNTSHNLGDSGFNLTTYPYAWTALADPTCTQGGTDLGSWWVPMIQELETQLGAAAVPLGLINLGADGAVMYNVAGESRLDWNAFASDTFSVYAEMQAVLAAAGLAASDPITFLCHLGENDAVNPTKQGGSGSSTPSTAAENLANAMLLLDNTISSPNNGIHLDYPNAVVLWANVGSVNDYNPYTWSASYLRGALDAVRTAIATLWTQEGTASYVKPGPQLYDLRNDLTDINHATYPGNQYGDGVHFFSQTVAVVIAARWVRCILANCYGGADPARGPQVNAASITADPTRTLLALPLASGSSPLAANLEAGSTTAFVCRDGSTQETISSAAALTATEALLQLSAALALVDLNAGSVTLSLASGADSYGGLGAPMDAGTATGTPFPMEPFGASVINEAGTLSGPGAAVANPYSATLAPANIVTGVTICGVPGSASGSGSSGLTPTQATQLANLAAALDSTGNMKADVQTFAGIPFQPSYWQTQHNYLWLPDCTTANGSDGNPRYLAQASGGPNAQALATTDQIPANFGSLIIMSNTTGIGPAYLLPAEAFAARIVAGSPAGFSLVSVNDTAGAGIGQVLALTDQGNRIAAESASGPTVAANAATTASAISAGAVVLPATPPAGYGGGGATPQQVDEQLSSTHGNGAWGPAVGPGPIPVSITCEDTAGNPLAGVEVWVTADAAGSDIIAGPLATGQTGIVVFMLAAGTWWLWRQAAGLSLASNPQAITVAMGG